MHAFTSSKLVELRQHDLRADAARARLDVTARRARRPRSRLDWLGRIASRRRPWCSRTPSATPAPVTSMPRPRSFDDLAAQRPGEPDAA